ncbi:MAG: T9SS type A sorting domain-containing protein [Saprospiraceae bacterium]|nr:T9SS type A sorting domain-containing protein [Saprospiraceae bacterium]
MKFIPLFLLLSSTLTAQVTLLEFPKNLQFYPRDVQTNLATMRIRGIRPAVSTDSLILEMNSSFGSQFRKGYALQDFPSDTFTINFPFEAGWEQFDFDLWEKSAAGMTLLATAKQIVGGDVIAIQGQSNAQAVAYNGDANIWQSPFIRCFGNSDPNNYTDTQWYMAEGNGYFTPGSIGQWALRMAYELQWFFQIPIAVINGADPGKPIEFFQRNDALPADPATNYGRFLQRLQNSGLDGHIRAMIYYQGESDGDRALIHKTLFEALHEDWRTDYPSIEAFYVVQVREGCGAPSLQLRQYQKEFSQYLPNTHAVTANGITGHDGCHYAVAGYTQLGEKLFHHLAFDLYGAETAGQLNFQALSARYTNETNTQIEIITDGAFLTSAPGSYADFLLSDGSSSVIGISSAANRIWLDLDQPVYNPSAGISYAGHAGDSGGWVLNSEGYGMYSFYNLPIENHTPLANYDIPGIMSGPGNCIQLDGQDDALFLGPVLGNSYTKEAWIYWQGGGLGNNMLSGAVNTAFWAPSFGSTYQLCAGHNGAWFQVVDQTPLKPFEWTHVALTYDEAGGLMRLYRNGNLVSEAQNIPPHNDPNLYVGAYAGGYTFHGRIDEVRIWDHPRTQDDIRANLCQKLKGNEAGLSAYFRFDQQDGLTALATTGNVSGQAQGAPLNLWRRSAAPLGTRSVYTYGEASQLSVALPSGDSLVWRTAGVPSFAHLYFTEEIPNVLEPADGHVLVDNQRYFGVHFPAADLDSFQLTYHYTGNPFTLVDEPRLNLLKRRDNAQPFWSEVDSVQFDFTQNTAVYSGKQPQEMILAIRENTVGASQIWSKKDLFYPNPASNWLFVQHPDLNSLVIYDLHGRKCLEHQGPVWVVDLQQLPAGMYLVEIRLKDERTFRKKLAVAR